MNKELPKTKIDKRTGIECAPVRCLIYSRWKSYLGRSNQPLVPRFWNCNCEVAV